MPGRKRLPVYSVFAFIQVFLSFSSVSAASLDIHFLDVGQGDAILIQSGGKAALVDAGPGPSLVPRLQKLGVTELDMMIISHNHLDHLGGALDVITSLPMRFFMDNGRPANTDVEARVLEGVRSARVTYLRPTFRTITLGDARLQIIPAPANVKGDEQNNQSVVVLLQLGKFRALLSGDSEVGELRALLATGHIPPVSVLKAAHHGSRNGVSEAWLAQTEPHDVVVSVGSDNKYGHPNDEALDSYQAHGARIWRTDLHGDIVVHVEGNGDYQVRRLPRRGK